MRSKEILEKYLWGEKVTDGHVKCPGRSTEVRSGKIFNGCGK